MPQPTKPRRLRGLLWVIFSRRALCPLTAAYPPIASVPGGRRQRQPWAKCGSRSANSLHQIDCREAARRPALLLSKRSPRGFFSGASVVARINRAEFGDFDAFILGPLLVSMYPSQIIIPDFGFYARDFHASLIRRNRLAVGLNALAELDRKMQQMALMNDKSGRGCTYEDAEALAATLSCSVRRTRLWGTCLARGSPRRMLARNQDVERRYAGKGMR